MLWGLEQETTMEEVERALDATDQFLDTVLQVSNLLWYSYFQNSFAMFQHIYGKFTYIWIEAT